MSNFKCVPGDQLALAASAFAIAIAKEVEDIDDLATLSNLFSAISSNLALIVGQRENCPPSKCDE